MSSSSEAVTHRKGFFPVVVGQDVRLEEAGGLVYIAKGNMTASKSGGQWLVAGGNQTIEQGGGAFLVSRQARVSGGFIGVLVAGRVTLEGGAKALLTIPLPVAAAAAAGFVAGMLIGRRRGA
jgi:hypothetical protein